MYTTLISAEQLRDQIASQSALVIVDCRFQLGDSEGGRRAYLSGHIPGALYAHLNENLSGEIIPGTTGRHPLPTIAEASRLFGSWGINGTKQVVVYDDKGGAIAARLWWMLGWLGHERVAVLDGGLPAWVAIDGAISTEIIPPVATVFQVRERKELIADRQEVDRIREDDRYQVIDSRTAPRYRGEEEPIDPIAGHIEGAINMPFPENMEGGMMKSLDELQQRFRELHQTRRPENTVFYCGSGVTACHNLLAYKHAGFGEARLYPGSWSEWITR